MALTPEQIEECAKAKRLFEERSTLSQREFAQRYDLGTPGNLWQYLNGRRALNLDAAVKIANGLGVSVADFSQRLAQKQAELSAPTSTNVCAAPKASKRIPLLTYAQAGQFCSRGQVQHPLAAIEAGDFIAVDDDTPDGGFALTVEGRSMEPVFLEGDVIVIDPSLTPRPGDYVLGCRINEFTGEFETTFKKYRARGLDEMGREVFELVPLNDDFSTINSAAHKVEIAGVMVEHRRSYRR